jgi:hypothetical protein
MATKKRPANVGQDVGPRVSRPHIPGFGVVKRAMDFQDDRSRAQVARGGSVPILRTLI